MRVDLPTLGKPDQGHVGHELQLEAEPALLALLALLGERRGPAPVGQEPGVALAAPTALGGQPAVALGGRGRRARCRRGRAPPCPRGRARSRSSPPWPCCFLPEPCVPEVGPAVRVVPEGEQRGHVAVGDQPDVAARPPSPPSGPPLATWASRRNDDAAGAAVAAPHVDLALVDELGHASRIGPDRCRRHYLTSGP